MILQVKQPGVTRKFLHRWLQFAALLNVLQDQIDANSTRFQELNDTTA